jgi:hypothetical protein
MVNDYIIQHGWQHSLWIGHLPLRSQIQFHVALMYLVFCFFILLIERLRAFLLCRAWVYLNKIFFVEKYYHWVDVLPTSRKPINLRNLPIALLLITAGVEKSRTGSKRENEC